LNQKVKKKCKQILEKGLAQIQTHKQKTISNFKENPFK